MNIRRTKWSSNADAGHFGICTITTLGDPRPNVEPSNNLDLWGYKVAVKQNTNLIKKKKTLSAEGERKHSQWQWKMLIIVCFVVPIEEALNALRRAFSSRCLSTGWLMCLPHHRFHSISHNAFVFFLSSTSRVGLALFSTCLRIPLFHFWPRSAQLRQKNILSGDHFHPSIFVFICSSIHPYIHTYLYICLLSFLFICPSTYIHLLCSSNSFIHPLLQSFISSVWQQVIQPVGQWTDR